MASAFLSATPGLLLPLPSLCIVGFGPLGTCPSLCLIFQGDSGPWGVQKLSPPHSQMCPSWGPVLTYNLS